ncbi:hypothetical protein [Enterococcus avium]|uniref:hypothetical protein n=1 Tax=Enterococcus avium TaxID=33945 RepID=UPI0012AB6D68|nr:hypothetical protein [Enterococcus avium]
MELLKYLDTEADKLHEENISSSDEFRTVNHSFVEGFNYALAIVQGFEVELNENQQVVLEWLKEAHQIGWHVLELFDTLLNRNYIGFDEKEHSKMDRARTAILVMGETEVFQLLAALAEWGKEKVAE